MIFVKPLDDSIYRHDHEYDHYAAFEEQRSETWRGRLHQIGFIIGDERRMAYKRGLLVDAPSIDEDYTVTFRIQLPIGAQIHVIVPQQLQRNNPLIDVLAALLPGGKDEAMSNDWHAIRRRKSWETGTIDDLLQLSPPVTWPN